ncbi:MAG: hypothetical protein AAF497_20000, partial [Planctomycetota bacterium]
MSYHDGELIDETWYVHKIEDAKIGHRWTRTFNVQIAKRKLIRTLTIDELRIPRFGRTVSQSIRSATLETAEGKILQLAYETKSGATKRTYSATVAGDTLHWESQNAKRRHGTVAWKDSIGGYQSLERQLRQSPLADGESRKITVMMPLFDEPVTYRLSKPANATNDLPTISVYSGSQSTASS